MVSFYCCSVRITIFVLTFTFQAVVGPGPSDTSGSEILFWNKSTPTNLLISFNLETVCTPKKLESITDADVRKLQKFVKKHCKEEFGEFFDARNVDDDREPFDKETDHVIVCQHIGHTSKTAGKNTEKWVGVLSYRKSEERKWDVSTICTNVKSDRHSEYGLTGTKLMEFFEQQPEIHDGDKLCLLHDPENHKMRKLANKLHYNDAGSGIRSKHKGNGGGGTTNVERECKKRSRVPSPASDSEGGKDDGGTKKSEHPDQKKAKAS